MPEMPEVAAVAAELDAKMRGKTIAAGHLVAFSALKTFRIGLDALAGLEVSSVTRHGKFLDVDAQARNLRIFSGANSVAVQNRRLDVLATTSNGAVVNGILNFDGAALSDAERHVGRLAAAGVVPAVLERGLSDAADVVPVLTTAVRQPRPTTTERHHTPPIERTGHPAGQTAT